MTWATRSPVCTGTVDVSQTSRDVSASSSGSPGSWNHGRPARSCSSLARSSSLATTSWPMRARHAAVTRPTCPAPMTATCMLRVPPVVGGGVVDSPLAAGDVGQPLAGPADPVVAADDRAGGVVVDPDAVLAAGAEVAGVPGDLVAPAPAGSLDVDLEAV